MVPFSSGTAQNTTTTITFQEGFASDATPKRNLMADQMKNLCGFSVFHCVEGAFGASSGGTPKDEKGGPREMKSKMVVVVVGLSPIHAATGDYHQSNLTFAPDTKEALLEIFG